MKRHQYVDDWRWPGLCEACGIVKTRHEELVGEGTVDDAARGDETA